MKYNDIVLVRREFGEPEKAKVNWVRDGEAGITYLYGKGYASNVVKVSELTLLKKSRGFKYNDIVRSNDGEARVNWVENGNVGITYLSPPDKKGAASIVKELELALISASAKNEMAERIASISDKELEERMLAIRRRRYPKAPTTRKRKEGGAKLERVAKEPKVSLDDIFKKMEENPKIKEESNDC